VLKFLLKFPSSTDIITSDVCVSISCDWMQLLYFFRGLKLHYSCLFLRVFLYLLRIRCYHARDGEITML